MIEFRNVSFYYSEKRTPVVNDLNLTINKGEWVALVGHNGSGKSTLAKMMNGLLMPKHGQVLVDDIVVSDERIWDIRNKVGMVFQNPENQFVATTVLDDVVFGLENMQLSREEMERRVDESLRLVGLYDYKRKEPFNLSGGQKQRLAIAGILAILPSVLILDEATTMLDPVSREELSQTILNLHEKKNLTTISITHNMNEVLMANRVIVLKGGEIYFDGQPSELLSNQAKLNEAGLVAPYVTQLTRAFNKQGVNFESEPFHIKDLVKQL